MNDSIALIIAYYNGSEFVEAALLSAFNQIIPFDEIIVVNDGSNEDESLVIEELCLKYKNLRIISLLDQLNLLLINKLDQ